jgi:hypothetical protein
MAAHVHLAVLSCVLLICGCHASPQPPPQSSSSRATLTPKAATEEVLAVGMGLGDALEMITRHGIEFRIGGGAWLPPEDIAAAQMFEIERRDLDDALIIYAESESGEKMRVRDLYWWRNYQAEIKRPKGLRKYEFARVKSLTMAEIERQFSMELNPYDSEKVAAREGAK